MKIIIAGCGKVGYTLAEHLSREDHDVTIIDTNDAALQRANDVLDVMCVRGNGASVSTLLEAGVASADLVIAASNADEINMICCLTAKRLGAGYAIARIRDIEYSKEINVFKRELGIDMTINPEYATAVEISRLLRFPNADDIDTFYRGRVELIGFRVQEDDFICGKALSALRKEVRELPILFCAAERGEELIIPGGSYVPQAGDKLYLIGQPGGMTSFFKLLGRYAPKVRSVMMVGGGRIAYYLASMLERMNLDAKIIERSEERCRLLSDALPKAMIICGDGCDQELLESENIDSCDAFVALTDRDEDNLVISLYAMQRGLPKVIAKSNRQNYAGIARAVGLDSVISPKQITADQILRTVRGMENSRGSVMNALYRIADGKAEAAEFTINDTTRHLGTPIRDLKLRQGVLIAILVHEGRIIIPEGSSCLSEGDSVVIISHGESILDLNDIFDDGPVGVGAL